MKNKLLILIVLPILFSCNSNNQKGNTSSMIGKYINTFEKDAIHFVELKADSSFIHYYKKGKALHKENKGIWSVIESPKKIEIKFDTWIDYGYTNISTCNGCIRFVKVRDGELIFSYDLPDEMNFIKE